MNACPILVPSAPLAAEAISDLEVARRVAANDGAAFIVLMRRYNRMLYRAARSVLNDESDAEDAVQDAYLQAYRTIGQFRGEAKLSTWLVRIVLNAALARARVRSRGLALAIRLDGEAQANQTAPEAPEHAVQRSEAHRILQGKIDALPAALRSVFVLRAVEDLSVDEVAAALDLPKAIVRVRFFRAKRLLRTALASQSGISLAALLPFAGERCNGIVAAVLARRI